MAPPAKIAPVVLNSPAWSVELLTFTTKPALLVTARVCRIAPPGSWTFCAVRVPPTVRLQETAIEEKTERDP